MLEPLFGILSGDSINVGNVIFDNIMARRTYPGRVLGYPSLIWLLCREAGVDMTLFEQDLEMGPPIALPNINRFHLIMFMPPDVSEASIAPPPSRRQPTRRERSKQVDHRRPKAKAPPKRAISEQVPQKVEEEEENDTNDIGHTPPRPSN